MKRKKCPGVDMFAAAEKIAGGYWYYSATDGKVPPCRDELTMEETRYIHESYLSLKRRVEELRRALPSAPKLSRAVPERRAKRQLGKSP